MAWVEFTEIIGSDNEKPLLLSTEAITAVGAADALNKKHSFIYFNGASNPVRVGVSYNDMMEVLLFLRVSDYAAALNKMRVQLIKEGEFEELTVSRIEDVLKVIELYKKDGGESIRENARKAIRSLFSKEE